VVPPNLKERFIFTGERSDVHRLMQAMDVFCLSSKSEAFPNVLGEAMACAVPCVSTDVGGCREIIGDTGVLVPPSDSRALALGLLALLEKPVEELRSLGRAARERIQARYSLSRAVEEYSNVYERLGIKGRR
jgi:glycosyltransferase involved in cell wall biosynthesis